MENYLKTLSALQAGKAKKALLKKWNIDNNILTTKQICENAEFAEIKEIPVNSFNRKIFNSLNSKEQILYEEKVYKNKTKTVYLVGGYELGKVAYEYYKFIHKKDFSLIAEGKKDCKEVLEKNANYILSEFKKGNELIDIINSLLLEHNIKSSILELDELSEFFSTLFEID